ncbi:MORN repeat-containing protein 3-like [Acyrthosiphon pisum]|uniref:MORN repeat-containing protein 3 n=1 Tax=Acyrthosiphon pisum TaxID=7029 RepID=A0A8R2A5D1_ACYPI|nr:MORN repeat-containing protein 3-like [Acyrthosiphon pisum]|eukprot:XP_001948570.2 PREDICTED: MORN repeat-containing protein 3-like [Acyrthosiphon pisum]
MASNHRSCGPSRIQWLEQKSMKNGFKPGVYEKYGLYVGNWEDDKKQGKGKMFYKNYTVYEGDWVANKRHGFGVLMKKVDDHFVYVYEGQWINNRFAKGKLYEAGGIYDGSFSMTGNRIKCGYGTMRWNDGAIYQGHWRNKEHDGRGKLTEVNGNVYAGQWRNGLRHGEGVYVFKDKGQLMEGVWIGGELKLSTIRYLDESTIARTQYVMPEISKSDEKSIGEEYENAKSKMLKNL